MNQPLEPVEAWREKHYRPAELAALWSVSLDTMGRKTKEVEDMIRSGSLVCSPIVRKPNMMLIPESAVPHIWERVKS